MHESHALFVCCPTCGHPSPIDDIADQLSPRPRQLYELVKTAGRQGIRQDRLEWLMYGSDPRSPTSDVLKVMVCTAINPKLKLKGLGIKSRKRIYRLEPLP